MVAEALALRDALKFAYHKVFTKISVEGDLKIVIDGELKGYIRPTYSVC